MDVRERILAAMTWQEPDQIPLTIYDWMIPRGAAERELREMGLGIIQRLPAHREEHRRVHFDSTEYWDQGRHMVRRTICTPVGEVSQVAQLEAAYGSTWILEHYVKRPEDYEVMQQFPFWGCSLPYSPPHKPKNVHSMRISGRGEQKTSSEVGL